MTFRRNLDGVIHASRLNRMNDRFNLHSDFRHTDIRDMLVCLDAALRSLDVIRSELQK